MEKMYDFIQGNSIIIEMNEYKHNNIWLKIYDFIKGVNCNLNKLIQIYRENVWFYQGS